jgi:hypothetical protein
MRMFLCQLGLPAVLLAGMLAFSARADSWIDRLPADDPGLAAGQTASPAQALRRDAAAGGGQAPAGQTSEAETSGAETPGAETRGGQTPGRQASTDMLAPVYGAFAAVAALPAKVGQAVWEVSYIFGINRTPASRPVVMDAVPDMDDPADAASAAPTQGAKVAARNAAPAPPWAEAKLAPSPPPPAQAQPAVEAQSPPAGEADDEVDAALLANFIYDRGERRPDGSFFVPKTLQRLFKVRTVRVTVADVPATIKLPGRIVPNPHTHGRVEASQLGRFEAPETGLPVLGDKVQKGQLLGLVAPVVGVVDRQQVRRDVERLTTQIRMQTESLEIIKQFSFVPFRDGKIYQAEQALAGLRRERDALLPLLRLREPLRAPTSGVISVAEAVAGKIVNPGDLIFEIVDPTDLWVEATAPDPAAADDATRVRAASALTPEGQELRLSFVGSGLTLKQQATPILFSIDQPPDGLRVGRPVTVTVRSEARSRRGMPVSRDAVTIGTDGVEEVWEQTAAETFLPHPVRTQDIDGATVLVVNGLAEGAHVVVRGSKLMAQLQ